MIYKTTNHQRTARVLKELTELYTQALDELQEQRNEVSEWSQQCQLADKRIEEQKLIITDYELMNSQCMERLERICKAHNIPLHE